MVYDKLANLKMDNPLKDFPFSTIPPGRNYPPSISATLAPTNEVATDPSSIIRKEEKIATSANGFSEVGASDRKLDLTNELKLGTACPSQLDRVDASTEQSKDRMKLSSPDEEAVVPPSGLGAVVHMSKSEAVTGDDADSDSKSDSSEDHCDEGVEIFPVDGGGKYRDYSRAKLRSDPVASIFAAASSKDPTFPVKLHQILSTGEFEDIIAWLPHGRAFRVLQPKAFEERVIPLFFRHGRYASFARQVNGWGFHRITNGPDYGSYYHELFLRGLPHLCEQMRRPQPGGPRKSRKEISSEPSPNFYEISEKASLPELPPREPSSFGSLAPPSMHNPPRLADAAISNNGLSGAGPVVGAMVEGNSRTENLNAASPTAQRYNAASSAAFAGMGMGGMGSITGIGGMGVAIPGFCAGLSHHSAHPVAGAAMLAGAVGPSAGLPGGAASAAPLLLQGMGSAGAPTTGLPQQFHGIGAAASLMPNIFGMGGIGQANLFGASGLLPGQQQQGQQMVSNGNGQGAGYLQLPDGGTSGP